MSDERLRRDDDALLGKLLRAGDTDEPSSQTVQKVLLAVTATASATGAASAAGAAGAAKAAGAAGASGSSALLSGGVLKWLGIGVLFGVGTSVGVQAALNSDSQPAPTLAAKTAALPGLAEKAGAALREPKAAPIQPEEMVAPVPNAETSPAIPAPPAKAIGNPAARSPSNAAPAASSNTLKDELLVLERARGAVAQGNSAAANSAISEYRTRFPKGRLYPELTLVRIDLLAQSGRQAQARQLAARFLANHPQSPSAARLKARFGLGD